MFCVTSLNMHTFNGGFKETETHTVNKMIRPFFFSSFIYFISIFLFVLMVCKQISKKSKRNYRDSFIPVKSFHISFNCIYNMYCIYNVLLTIFPVFLSISIAQPLGICPCPSKSICGLAHSLPLPICPFFLYAYYFNLCHSIVLNSSTLRISLVFFPSIAR